MSYQYRVTNPDLGLDVGLEFQYEPNERDVFDMLKKNNLVNPREVMHLAESEDEAKRQFALNAYKNGFFEQPEPDVDWLEVGGEVLSGMAEGFGDMVLENPISDKRLEDLAMATGGLEKAVDRPVGTYGMFDTGTFTTKRFQYPGEIDDELSDRLNKAGAQVVEDARRPLSWEPKDAQNTLSLALQKQGFDIEDQDIRKEVSARAIDLQKLADKATFYQATTNVVGGYRMLGSLAKRELSQSDWFSDKSDQDILEEIKHMAVMHDTMDTIEKGAWKGSQIWGVAGMRDKVAEVQIRNAMKDGLIEPRQGEALLMEVVGDIANPLTGLAGFATQRGMRTIVKGQREVLRKQLMDAEMARRLIAKDIRELGQSKASQVLSRETLEGIEKPLFESYEQARKQVDDLSQKLLKLDQGAVKAPLFQKGVGLATEKAGQTLNKAGQALEWLYRVPKELAIDTLVNGAKMTPENAERLMSIVTSSAIAGTGVAVLNNAEVWDSAWTNTLAGLGVLLGPTALQKVGISGTHLGQHLQKPPGSRNFFEYYQQLDTQPFFSSALVDRTGDHTIRNTLDAGKDIFKRGDGIDSISQAVAKGLTKTKADKVASFVGRTGMNLASSTAIPGAIGYATGGEAGMVGSISASLPFLGMGMYSGELLRFSDKHQLGIKQRGDVTNHRKNLSEEDAKLFDNLSFPNQVALATAQIKYPNARFILHTNDDLPNADGYHTMNDGQSEVHINVDSNEPLAGVLGHELGHHMVRHGLGPMISEIFFGSVALEKPGIYSELVDGKPVIEYDANGTPRYKTNQAFADARQKYLDRLEASGSDEMFLRKYQNPNEILEEVVAEHVAHDMLRGRDGGILNDSVGQVAKSLYGALTGKGFKREAVLGMGGYTDEFGNGIFQMEENKALSKLIKDFERESSRSSKKEMDGRIDPNENFNDVDIKLSDVRGDGVVEKLFNNRLQKDSDGNIIYGLDGLPKLMSDAKIDKMGAGLSADIAREIEARGDNLPAGHVRMRESADGEMMGEGLFLDDSIIDSLASNGKYSASQINFLRQASQVGRQMAGGDYRGNEVLMFYYPATRGGRKYKSLRGGYRTGLVWGIQLTKGKNINLQTLSINGIENNINKLMKSKRRTEQLYQMFGGTNDSELKANIFNLLKKSLGNHQKGIENGTEGSGITATQKDYLNALMGVNTPVQWEKNPLFKDLPKLESTIRSRRIERIGSLEQKGRGAFVDYTKIRDNLMPKSGVDTPGQMVMDDSMFGDLLEQNPQVERVKIGDLDYIPRVPDYDMDADIPALANKFLDIYNFDSEEMGMFDTTADRWAEKHNIDSSKFIGEARKQLDERNGFYRFLPKSDEYKDHTIDELEGELAFAEKEFEQYGSLQESLAPMYPEPGQSSSFLNARNEKAQKVREIREVIKQREQNQPVEFERLMPKTPGFEAWRGNAEFIEHDSYHVFAPEEPVVIEGFHGSFKTFNQYDKGQSIAQGDKGAGFYITNSPLDASANYASIEGGDPTTKIEQMVDARLEQMEVDLYEKHRSNESETGVFESIDTSDFIEKNRQKVYDEVVKEFKGDGAQVYKVYAKFENPVVIGSKSSSIEGRGETILEMKTDPTNDELYGSMVDFIGAMDDAMREYNIDYTEYLNQMEYDLYDFASEWDGRVPVSELIDRLEQSDYLLDAWDNNMGDNITNEVIRKAFENAGYDGIIDQSVNQKWGSESGRRNAMRGVDPGTTHFIAFKPGQIKSATGNRGTFDPTNPDMRMIPKAPNTPEFKNFFKESKVTNDDGTPRVVMHGTRSEPFTIFGNRSEELSAIGMHYFTSVPEIAEHFGPKAEVTGEYMIQPKRGSIKINVKTTQGDQKVDGLFTNIPGLFVTKTKGMKDSYSLTHQESGNALGKFDSEGEINNFLQRLKDIDADWTQPTEKVMQSLGSKGKQAVRDAYKLSRQPPGFDEIAQEFGYGSHRTGYGRVNNFYLSMQKPIDLTSIQAGRNISSVTLRKKLKEYGIDLNPVEFGLGERKLYQFLNSPDFADELRALARGQGYDGIIYNDIVEGKKGAKGESYIVFQSNQIKSADRNVGSFNPSDPDVRYLPNDPRPENKLPGFNVRNEPNTRFADLIIDGSKTIETRARPTLNTLVGKTAKVIRTGEGKAQVIGEVTIGEPIVYNTLEEFQADKSKHLVPTDSNFAFEGKKYGYPLTKPRKYAEAYDAPENKGIVTTREVDGARMLPKKAKEHPEAFPVVQKVDKKGNPVFKYDKTTKKNEPVYQEINYDLMGSPMAERHLGEKTNNKRLDFSKINVRLKDTEKKRLQEIYNTDFLDEAVQEMQNDYIDWMKDKEVRAGKGWYSRMRKKLKDALGDRTEFFAQLLGATSANTPVEENFKQAVEAMQLFDEGEYDTMIKQYNEIYDAYKKGPEVLYKLAIDRGIIEKDFVTLKDGSFTKSADKPANVIGKCVAYYDLVPKRRAIDKETGKRKKFNINSNAVMKVFAGSWLELTGAPKTPNFAGNLTGRTLEATIDVWAGRYLRRMMYRGQKQWRIQPASETGVSNIDFALGQMVFRETADRLGINPDDLQAIAWFGEKGVWDTNRWTGEQGAYKSSFDEPFDIFFPKGDKPRSYQEGGNIIKLKQAERRVMKGNDMVAKPSKFDKSKEEAKDYLLNAQRDVEKAKLRPGVAEYFLRGR